MYSSIFLVQPSQVASLSINVSAAITDRAIVKKSIASSDRGTPNLCILLMIGLPIVATSLRGTIPSFFITASRL